MKRLLPLVIIICSLTGIGFKKANDIKNYYNIPEVLTYGDKQYKLVASYHPSDDYYKQEYIPAHESADHYNTLLLVDFYITDSTAHSLVGLKLNELASRKKTDIVCNYQVLSKEDKGEYILDFILSDAAGNNITLAERNIYHYTNYTDKAGHKGILLFGISNRAYGDDITPYLKSIKATMPDDIHRISTYELPQIEIK